MSTVSLIVACLLLALGISLLGFLGYHAFSPLLKVIKSTKINSYQAKKKQCLIDFLNLIEQESFTEALKLLNIVPYLDAPNSSESFLFIRDHNQDFVTRCFFLFEKLGRPTSDVASLEMLFNERFELFTHLFKSQVNKKVLEEKHETDKKKLPSWAKNEFSNKEKELNAAIENNLKDIERSLDKLSKGYTSSPSENLTIH